MGMDKHLEQWLAEDIQPELHLTPLPDGTAGELVQFLKQEADRYWYIDPNISLKYADRIISIGRARKDKSQEALGLMARGDALKFLGNLQEAWDTLEQSGNMFQEAGDEVGWARTRIGRVYLSVKLNYVPDALADVERARTIFIHYGEQEKLLRFNLNLATVHFALREEHKALELYHASLAIAGALGETGNQYLGLINMNMGVAYAELGD